jgi:hypothetical protein
MDVSSLMTTRRVPATATLCRSVLRFVGVVLFGSAVALAAAPTAVEFTTTHGRFLGLSIADGHHGSADVPGLTLQFNLAHANATPNGGALYFQNLGNGVAGIAGNDGWGDPMLVIKSQGNARFSFQGFRIENPRVPGVNEITVTGVADGKIIGSVDLALGANPRADFTTLQLTPAIFGRVDEVRITSRIQPFGPVQGPRLLNLFNRFVFDAAGGADLPPKQSRVFFADFLHGSAKVGEIAATLPVSGGAGHLVIVAPTMNLNLAVDFALQPDGTFVKTIVANTGSVPAARGSAPSVAAAAQTLTLRGSFTGGVLSGGFDELPYTFSTVEQGAGPSSAAAGVYVAPVLNSASGSVTTIVGNNNEVLALAVVGDLSLGGRATLGTDGSFEIVVGSSSLSGTVQSGTINGMVRQAARPSMGYSGVSATAQRTDRLVNLSSRVRIAPSGGRTLITGFVIGGTSSKRVLLRAIGPALATFGVAEALANPRLELFDTAGVRVLQNDDWAGAETSAAFAQVGAFTLAPATRDAALVALLAPGAYTMQVLDGGETGVVLAEIYDASLTAATDPQRLVNISSRGVVDAEGGALIGGFGVTGNAPKRLLVRGIGPGLGALGVEGTLNDPRLTIYSGQTAIAVNDDWGTPASTGAGQIAATGLEIAAAAQATGAFTLPGGSKDAAVIVTLAPGAYTAQVSAADGGSGTALVEVYEVP